MLEEVAMALATAIFRSILKGGNVDGNSRGSGVNGLFQHLALSRRDVAIAVKYRSGSFIHCNNELIGLTYIDNCFRFLRGIPTALLLPLIFRGPRVAN